MVDPGQCAFEYRDSRYAEVTVMRSVLPRQEEPTNKSEEKKGE